MKTRVVIVLLILCACEPPIRFESPQPEGRKNERSIPRSLIGTYLNPIDSSKLIVSDQHVVSITHERAASLLSDMDSVDRVKIKGDTSYVISDEELTLKVVVKKDSVFIHTWVYDTLYKKPGQDVVRKFKGYYFLNQQIGIYGWRVTKIGKLKHGVVVGSISREEDLDDLRELTNTSKDTLFNFSPTGRQFRKFVRQGGFSDEKIYVRM
jgi:hypothetical protein